MGIWDKIKSAKNYLTGGGVSLELLNPEICYLRKPFNVVLYVKVDEVDVEIDSIYIHLKQQEKVSVPVRKRNSQGDSRSGMEHKTHLLYERKFLIEEDVILDANERYEFEVEIELPPNAFPSFLGKYTELVWSMRAVAEKSGTNPKSEKFIFEPYYEFK